MIFLSILFLLDNAINAENSTLINGERSGRGYHIVKQAIHAADTVIYQSKSGSLELKADIQQDTVWANLLLISNLFGTDKSGILRHNRNIFNSGELSKKELLQNLQQFKRREAERYCVILIITAWI